MKKNCENCRFYKSLGCVLHVEIKDPIRQFCNNWTMNSSTCLVKVKKLRENAKIPQYKSESAACFDISLLVRDGKWRSLGYLLKPDEVHRFETGLAFEIPEGYMMKIYVRSGWAGKGLMLYNTVAIIDSDYRGMVYIGLINTTNAEIQIMNGDRVVQGMIEKVIPVEFEEVDELSKTKRGSGGFGSTGDV